MNVRNEKVKKLISGFAAALGCMVIAGSLFMASPLEAHAVVLGSDPNGTSAPADNTENGTENGGDEGNAEVSDPAENVSTATVTSATVIKDNVNVRGDASTSANAVGKASAGMDLPVSGEKQDSEGKTWYAVTFESNGSTVSGYIREDMVEAHVTEEQPVESEPVPEEQPAEAPEEQPVVTDDFTAVYEDDGTGNGTNAWYLHDNTMGNKYKIEELLSAQEINKSNQELMDQQTGKMRMIIVAMAVVILILIVVVTVFILKLRNAYDDDDWDDDDDEEDEEEEEEEAPRKRRFGRMASRRRDEDDEEDEDEEEEEDEDDDVEEYRPKRKLPAGKTVKEKPSRRARYEEDEDDDEEEEYRPRRSTKPSKAQGDKSWQSKNFLDDDDLEFEFLDLK